MRGALAVASVLLLSSSARAALYFVAPTGDDGGLGTAARPWKTLQHAADEVTLGDGVTVEAGHYVGFSLGWDHAQNGTAQLSITFTARPGVVVDATNWLRRGRAARARGGRRLVARRRRRRATEVRGDREKG